MKKKIKGENELEGSFFEKMKITEKDNQKHTKIYFPVLHI